MRGQLCLTTSSVVQELIGLSSGEIEFYAAVIGGAALLELEALTKDWRVAKLPVLHLKTDSSAAESFASRRGLGRNRHVSIRFLRMQDAIASGRLRTGKAGTL